MSKLLTYCLFILVLFSACEEIYTPKLEERENSMVVDARLMQGNAHNYVRLYKSLGFNNESNKYPPIDYATVWLIDNAENSYELSNIGDGMYSLGFKLKKERAYRLKISYNGNIFESEFEEVPDVPVIDTIYGYAEKKVLQFGAEDEIDRYREVEGLQLYTDIVGSEVPYYRFSADKIMQYIYSIEIMVGGEPIEENVFAWNTYYPDKGFNIAGPAEFSTSKDIIKHPLYFMNKRGPVTSDNYFAGWILVLYQYGISKKAHSYYKDLNSQLYADGKLFDPLYVQARNNLKCTSNPEQTVLGNFEISSFVERRYFVEYISDDEGYLIKPIPYFYYIPHSGEQITIKPEWWESANRQHYPND